VELSGGLRSITLEQPALELTAYLGAGQRSNWPSSQGATLELRSDGRVPLGGPQMGGTGCHMRAACVGTCRRYGDGG
jgi:hypothetical protein